MRKTARILTVVFTVVALFGSTLTAQAATVKSNKKVKYYKTASVKKKAGTFKKATKLNAVSMAKGFIKFKKGRKTLYIKATDVKISGKFTAKVSKKTKAYNNKFKATKTVLKKNTSLTISGMKVKKKVAYLKYTAGKYVKATDVKVTSFVVAIPTVVPTEASTEAPTVIPTEEATIQPTQTVNVVPTPEPTHITPEDNNTWDDDGVLKILTIGGSFSDDCMEYVYNIGRNVGIEKIELGNLYYGGGTLSQHLVFARDDEPAYEYRTNTSGVWMNTSSTKMSTAIQSNNWDFISLQQASGYSGDPNSYAYLLPLIKRVKAVMNPEAKLVWNMTWAYQQDSTHQDFPKYNSDQMTMYNAIVDTVTAKVETQSDITLVIPTGTALQNVRTSYVGDTLTRDGYHLSLDYGRYVAGLTFVRKLGGVSIDNVSFKPSGVSEEYRKIAVEAVNNAVETPKSVTQSTYIQVP